MQAFTATLIAALLLGAPPSYAWSTAPWDATEFDAPVDLSASQRAEIAAAEAHMMAEPATQRNQADVQTPNITGGKNCSVNVGTISTPSTGAAVTAVTDVNVGEIINICN